MYGREYAGKTLSFEPSGGLANSSLVMQDKETDTYWGLMNGAATAGPLKGTLLEELPVGRKARWRDWVQQHPDTLVLSVGGREDVARDPYSGYFASPKGFRGQEARDRRLPSKTPIFAFRHRGTSYAVAHATVEGGRVISLPGAGAVLLYRARGADALASTVAFAAGEYEARGGHWIETRTGCRLEAAQARLTGERCPARLSGFDTFWYNWSLNNPETVLLTP